MSDENNLPPVVKKISRKTYAEMRAEQQAILDEFFEELDRMKQAGMSLRAIGEFKKINYETARQLLKKNEEGSRAYTRT